jgi:hypothetical protein
VLGLLGLDGVELVVRRRAVVERRAGSGGAVSWRFLPAAAAPV